MNENFSIIHPQPHGYVEPEIEEENYILGDGNLVGEVLQADGQWDFFLPEVETQRQFGVETSGCTAYASLNCIEMLLQRKYGLKANYSERFTGIAAGTYPPGNDPHTVAEAIRKQGVIPEDELPFDTLTLEEYYLPNPLPNYLIQKAKEWLFWYDFKHEYVFKKNVPEYEKRARLMSALKYSPVGVSVFAWAQNPEGLYTKLGNDNHWTVLFGYEKGKHWKIFDSYDAHVKKLEWNYNFGIAKRYSINKHGSKPKQKSFSSMIKRYLYEIFR